MGLLTRAKQITYKLFGNNTAIRTVDDKLGEFVSVKDFLCDDGLPVMGDGIHDDTTGIQKAFNHPSSIIIFEKGDKYLINSNGLILANSLNKKIIGNGAELKLLSASTQTITGFSFTFIKLFNCAKVTINDLILNVNNKACAGLGLQNCISCIIERNEIFGCAGGSGGIVSSNGLHNCFSLNKIHDLTNETRGMWIGNNNTGYDEKYSIIKENEVYNCDATGIVLTGSHAKAYSNHCYNNNGSGIIWSGIDTLSTAATSVIISNNTCNGNSFHGIQQDGVGTYAIQIITNVCFDNLRDGIYFSIAKDINISNNICYNNKQFGINTDCVNNFCLNNNICYDTREGLSRTQKIGIRLNAQLISGGIDGIKNGTINGNICRNNLDYGFFLNSISASYNVSNITINGNLFIGNGNSGAFINESSKLALTSIIFSNNSCTNNIVTDIRTTLIDIETRSNSFVTQIGYFERDLDYNSSSPNINGRETWVANNSSVTSITSLIGGKLGQEITIFAKNGNTTINNVSGIIINPNGSNITIPANGWVKYKMRETMNRWFLLDKSF